MALGLTQEDWSGWYRLFSRSRVARLFFRETLPPMSPAEPYVVGVDGVQIPRSSLKLAGTSWLKAPRTPVFKVGIHRAQRFVHGAWLTPLEHGYSRAIPLRFLPAFPPKAKPAPVALQREWKAGLAFLHWVRQELDDAGHPEQVLLALADGTYDTWFQPNGFRVHGSCRCLLKPCSPGSGNVGTRSRASRNEKRLWRRRNAMLESARHDRLRPMERELLVSEEEEDEDTA